MKSEAPYPVRCPWWSLWAGVDPAQKSLQDQGHPGQNGEISFVTKTLGAPPLNGRFVAEYLTEKFSDWRFWNLPKLLKSFYPRWEEKTICAVMVYFSQETSHDETSSDHMMLQLSSSLSSLLLLLSLACQMTKCWQCDTNDKMPTILMG